MTMHTCPKCKKTFQSRVFTHRISGIPSAGVSYCFNCNTIFLQSKKILRAEFKKDMIEIELEKEEDIVSEALADMDTDSKITAQFKEEVDRRNRRP